MSDVDIARDAALIQICAIRASRLASMRFFKFGCACPPRRTALTITGKWPSNEAQPW
jgi:hypothetical protein